MGGFPGRVVAIVTGVVDIVAVGRADIGVSKLSQTYNRLKHLRSSEPYLTLCCSIGWRSPGPLAIVLRPFGLSYEVAVPLMIIIDPLADMVRTMLNVSINCMIPSLAGGRAAVLTNPSTR